MSPKLPRDVDGARLVRVLCGRFGYREKNRSGSHVILEWNDGRSHLTVPEHKAVRVGTLASILDDFEEQTSLSRDVLLERL